MKIIKAQEKHVNIASFLFNEYRLFYQQEYDLEGARNYILERLKQGDSVIFLACSEDEKEGYGFTQLYPSFSSVSMRKIWILNDLFVAENARRNGVAKSLMNAAKELAVKTEAKGLALETGEDNVNAQKLYESIGYEKESGVYHYFLTV
ncbi:GNAT family N-acetyltransferase [Litchfieldia alkalitelluris]|uniref:GNAT family N-acetyltransferase n=1 Tax=Litchfieldia alkalitelluris TaxID=304268 RepID=UPI0009962748|nr:GNAT family N-acetyltransferase [Litchfieldia alkalitelluris]